MRNYIYLIFTALLSFTAVAQPAIGGFYAHMALHSFYSVAADDANVYATTENGLMILDKTTLKGDNAELSTWSKVDGLSDIDIVKIYHENSHNSLIVCYNNGNIDVIRNGRLVNIRDVKDKSLTASKRLQVCREIDGNLYLVYPFGIVILDMSELVVKDTWFTKQDNTQYTPTDIAHDGQKIYISTTEGMFRISKSSPMVNDFSQWERVNDWNVPFLSKVSDRIFAIKVPGESDEGGLDSLFVLRDDWEFAGKAYTAVRHMMSQQDTLLVCNWDAVELLDENAERLFYASWYQGVGHHPNAAEAVLDGHSIWAADRSLGLVQYDMTYYSYHFFNAGGPHANYVERVTSLNGVVAAVHGTRRASTAFAPGYRFPALSWYQNLDWQFNDQDFVNYDTNISAHDFTNVAINPKDETEWAIASWSNGLFKCKNHRPVAHYDASNSALDSLVLTPSQMLSIQHGPTYVSGLQYDKKGNLWMTNSYCTSMLKMLEPNGTWHAYNISSVVGAPSPTEVMADKLLVDSRGYKWVNFPRSDVRYHLIAFTDNGTYDNRGDDRLTRVDMNAAAEVTSSTVYCMAEDLDGEIWIGTDKGVKVIYYPSKIFDGNVYPRNILLEQDGYVSVLLEYEEVTAIAVDGANRKWIGTNKAGVFLMSENGQEQLLHFTAEDHPLFSNQIIDIGINQLTGEVFFATSNGLISYRGTATEGFETYEDLPVYPNPVPHGYTGGVAINGLKTNSLCKITDASGKLVWQGYSDGGQLVWYCKDHFGNRPATGVYYVMASDEEGKEKRVTKFVFIN